MPKLRRKPPHLSDVHLKARVTPEEATQVASDAAKAGLPVSDHLRVRLGLQPRRGRRRALGIDPETSRPYQASHAC